MYNRNYGGFDYVRHENEVRTGEAIHSGLLKSALNRKLTHINP